MAESNLKTSSELQEVVLSSLLKDSYILGKVKKDIQISFFDKLSYKLIYKSLLYYYNRYSQMPTIQSLMITVNDLYTTEYGDKKDINSDIVNLYNLPINSEEFVIDQITRFIKRHRVEDTLSKYLPKLKNGENISIDKLGEDLSTSVTIDLHRSNAFKLSDSLNFPEIRRDSVGSESNPTIVKSKFPSINNALMYKGYKVGDVAIVCARPGCFTGDTKVMTLDGECHTFEELYNNKLKLGIYGYNSGIKTGSYDQIQLTKYTDDLVYIEIDNNTVIKCTPDHLFMLRDGSYKRADELSELDCLMPIKREYRTACNRGSKLTDKSSGYECVIDGNNNLNYTHRLSASTIDHLDECTVVHHIDRNKLNNDPTNLAWMTSHDHRSLHGHDSAGISRPYMKGKHLSRETEFTSEYISNRNKENWKIKEYRDYMIKIISKNSKHSKMVTELNHTEEFQFSTRKGKVLSYINYMIKKYGSNNISIDNFNRLSDQIKEYRQHVHLEGVAKVYDCSIGHPKGRRYEYPDYDKLRSIWSLIIEEATNYNHKVTKITRVKLDKPVAVYDIVNSTVANNFAIAISDTEGVFVHNCGKTMFMVNELTNASMLGFNVLHLFIGDMTKYDGFIRYASCVTGTPQDEIVRMPEIDQINLVRQCNMNGHFDRITVESYSAGEITIHQLIDDIFKIQDQLKTHFDVIAVDYPDNLIPEKDMMYESGGEIYNKLSYLARRNKSVVIAGSQPKQSYWNSEIIPLDGCAESSKKQHVIDIMITLGKPTNDCPLLTGFLAKVRRGTVGGIFRNKTEFEKARMEQIPEMEYFRIKADYDGSKEE